MILDSWPCRWCHRPSSRNLPIWSLGGVWHLMVWPSSRNWPIWALTLMIWPWIPNWSIWALMGVWPMRATNQQNHLDPSPRNLHSSFFPDVMQIILAPRGTLALVIGHCDSKKLLPNTACRNVVVGAWTKRSGGALDEEERRSARELEAGTEVP